MIGYRQVPFILQYIKISTHSTKIEDPKQNLVASLLGIVVVFLLMSSLHKNALLSKVLFPFKTDVFGTSLTTLLFQNPQKQHDEIKSEAISLVLHIFYSVTCLGELMGLFSATPHHLHKLGLLDTLEQDEELEINFLMSQALITITTLPFHLVNDLWSWRVFRGEVLLIIRPKKILKKL